MGASDFTNFGNDTDAGKAFVDCREQAQYDHGHGGYSGTIAEKDDFVVIDGIPQPYETARAVVHKLFVEDDRRISDKWGPAGALRVKDDKHDGWLFFGYASS